MFILGRRVLSVAFGTEGGVSSGAMTHFGTLPDGRKTTLYSLVNARGARVDICDYGAIVVRLLVPDREGRLDDVVLGYSRVEDYVQATPYFGAVVGRYGNRIAHGRFTLDGRTYPLVTNDKPGGAPCHLHGGTVGFDKVLWAVRPSPAGPTSSLVLHYLSRDGDEGYPGNLDVTVTYTLDDDHALRVDYRATTDKPTPVNLTQHSYFNLKGEGRGDVLGHILTIHGSQVAEVNAGMIPTGRLVPVSGTPLDFTQPRTIGERVNAPHEQLLFGRGYDHTWVLDKPSGRMALAATVDEPESGRRMEVLTEEPGVQFYGGNFLDGSNIGKRGQAYQHRHGLCLETQHFPDSPNQPAFPSTLLRPGETYRTSTVYRFSTNAVVR